jgi:hypothetical protein
MNKEERSVMITGLREIDNCYYLQVRNFPCGVEVEITN